MQPTRLSRRTVLRTRRIERPHVGGTEPLATPRTTPPITPLAGAHHPALPYRLAARTAREGTTVVQVGAALFGGPQPVLIGGPCSVEDEQTLLAAAEGVRAAGGQVLRGGAFKPRTSPYAFGGLGEEGLRLLARARAHSGLPVVTEVMEPGDVDLVCRYADMLQIGSRNMQK